MQDDELIGQFVNLVEVAICIPVDIIDGLSAVRRFWLTAGRYRGTRYIPQAKRL